MGGGRREPRTNIDHYYYQQQRRTALGHDKAPCHPRPAREAIAGGTGPREARAFRVTLQGTVTANHFPVRWAAHREEARMARARCRLESVGRPTVLACQGIGWSPMYARAKGLVDLYRHVDSYKKRVGHSD